MGQNLGRRPRLAVLLIMPILFAACGSEDLFDDEVTPAGPDAPLLAADVTSIVTNAAQAISGSLSIAVVDRAGNILGVFSRPTPGNANVEEKAVSLARTAAFFSNDQAPLSSRTVAYISRRNFPGVVKNTPSAALFGIENTNRGCDLTSLGAVAFQAGQAIPPATNILGAGPGLGITTVPGGVPLFRNGRIIGGVGVAGPAEAPSEFAAFMGSAGFSPVVPSPGVIFIDGFELPFVEETQRPEGTLTGAFPGDGAFRVGPIPSPVAAAPYVPEGFLIGPNAGVSLTQQEVRQIVMDCVDQANRTRAAIRLPLSSRTRMVIAVAEGIDGPTEGQILALFRMGDATTFSIDVAATKSRNVVYFSSPKRFAGDLPLVPVGTAVTNRTIGFGAQSFFPSGIENTGPGPFRGLFEFDTANPCSQGMDPTGEFPPASKSGIVFFPGSSPLYKNGALVGGLGVSGDGVEQDDVVTEAGARNFLPPAEQRADQIVIDGVRLPFFKFNRNPEG